MQTHSKNHFASNSLLISITLILICLSLIACSANAILPPNDLRFNDSAREVFAQASTTQDKLSSLPPFYSNQPSLVLANKSGIMSMGQTFQGLAIVAPSNYFNMVDMSPAPAVSAQNTWGWVQAVRRALFGSVNSSSRAKPGAKEGEKDYCRLPILISPRNTALIDRWPTFVWSEAEGTNSNLTLDYQIQLSSSKHSIDLPVSVKNANCQNDVRLDGCKVCSYQLPENIDTELFPDETYRAFVGSHGENDSFDSYKVSLPEKGNRIRILPTTSQEKVLLELAKIQQLKADPMVTQLLEAKIYKEHQLFTNAITLYESMLEAHPAVRINTVYLGEIELTARIQIELGELYWEIGLNRFAEMYYQQAIQSIDKSQDDPELRALAEFGLGYIYYGRTRLDQAKEYFTNVSTLLQAGASNDMLFHAMTELGLGLVYLAYGDEDNNKQAEIHLEVAIKMFSKLNANEELRRAEDALELIRLRRG